MKYPQITDQAQSHDFLRDCFLIPLVVFELTLVRGMERCPRLSNGGTCQNLKTIVSANISRVSGLLLALTKFADAKTVRRTCFLEDVVHVILDRLLGQVQSQRDLFVGEALAQQFH